MSVESKVLYSVDERLKTFTNWPFDDKNKCNVRNMAEAGFYSVSTGDDDADAAKCFLCGKELDGWEASDDPWAEHKSHAPKCAFVQLGKKEDDLLVNLNLQFYCYFSLSVPSIIITKFYFSYLNSYLWLNST